MRRLLVFLAFLSVIQNSKAQNNSAVAIGAGVAAIAAAAYYENQMREMVEQSAMEWFLFNKPIKDGDVIEMKLIDWEIKSFTDISATKTLLFKYKVNREPTKVVMFILSEGWWNDYGIVFTRIKPVELGKEEWTQIVKKLLEISSDSVSYESDNICTLYYTRKEDIENNFGQIVGIRTVTDSKTVDVQRFKGIINRQYVFASDGKKNIQIAVPRLNGDTHLVGVLPEQDLIIDFNEKKLNIFNSETRDLIKISNGAVKEITATLL